MPLNQQEKEKIIKKHKLHEQDTGSPPVQIALLTKEINQLILHLKKHPKDHHSRRGLLKMVARRRKLQKFLAKEDVSKFKALAKELGLAKK